MFVDNGIDEFIAKFIDLPDIIVDLNRRFGNQDLKVFNFIEPEEKPIITTNGMYLNKISSYQLNLFYCKKPKTLP